VLFAPWSTFSETSINEISGQLSAKISLSDFPMWLLSFPSLSSSVRNRTINRSHDFQIVKFHNVESNYCLISTSKLIRISSNMTHLQNSPLLSKNSLYFEEDSRFFYLTTRLSERQPTNHFDHSQKQMNLTIFIVFNNRWRGSRRDSFLNVKVSSRNESSCGK
jgi:hypothetical protein